jgi:hypothetical protein
MRRPTLKWLEDADNYSGEPKVKRCQEKGIEKNDHVIKEGKVLRAPWSEGISISILSKSQYNVSQSTGNIITNRLTL